MSIKIDKDVIDIDIQINPLIILKVVGAIVGIYLVIVAVVSAFVGIANLIEGLKEERKLNIASAYITKTAGMVTKCEQAVKYDIKSDVCKRADKMLVDLDEHVQLIFHSDERYIDEYYMEIIRQYKASKGQ